MIWSVRNMGRIVCYSYGSFRSIRYSIPNSYSIRIGLAEYFTKGIVNNLSMNLHECTN